MSASLNQLQPALQPFARMLVAEAGRVGYQPRVTSTRRSNAEQVRLYRQFLAGGRQYPVARPGTSAHEYGWAFDMVLSPMSALADAGQYWESLGGVWGGRPTRVGSGYDPVHFEYPGWRSLVDWSAPDVRQQKEAGGAVSFESAAEKALSRRQSASVPGADFVPGPFGWLFSFIDLFTEK